MKPYVYGWLLIAWTFLAGIWTARGTWWAARAVYATDVAIAKRTADSLNVLLTSGRCMWIDNPRDTIRRRYNVPPQR